MLGELFDAKSQVELLSPAFYYHIKMDNDTRLDIPTDPTHNAFLYLIKGISNSRDNRPFAQIRLPSTNEEKA